ncbi:protein kinase domain-containing protein [Vibrio sp. SCSIO 43137]|uniref:protein kinase domain-containing protein n=1 Tax=Vibrio sp. SCSIO 43137 TaxID=3021011 RepID=UPI002307BD00|nr:protein kinase [Vibrio sp. SCSIO 43137]WCE31034.1 protein kinase [Vibrio sp. SCSIO 43137]
MALVKVRKDKTAFRFELKALQQCACYRLQPLLDQDSESKTLWLHYFEQADNFLSFSYKDADKFLTLLPQIIRAIRYCHQQGWVHGDIKPSNLLYLAGEERVILIDFAAALPIGQSREELTEWQFTSQFAREHQRKGEGVACEADDWYALKRWLEQLLSKPLTTRQTLKVKRIIGWLESQISAAD